jgi:thiamine-monophosphate kinase
VPDRIRPEGKGVISDSSSTASSVAAAGEFGLIARVVERLRQGSDVIVGPGDDAAVVAAPDGRVVATMDVLVEGRHFRRDWSSGYDVGRRAAAASLADVVAMGARPTALVVGLSAPADLDAGWAEGLADGLRDEADLVGASVVGGDVSAADAVSVAVTALGDLEGREAVTRAGALPGDRVVLLGRIGWAAAGLAMLEAGNADHPLADAHRRPQVAYDDALAAARVGALTSLIDVSDGLVADLGHVAEASNVRMELSGAALPIAPEVADAAAALGVDPFDWVAGGGDDHAFAGTVRGEVPSGAVVVGVVIASGDPGVGFTDRAAPVSGGHEHFS